MIHRAGIEAKLERPIKIVAAGAKACCQGLVFMGRLIDPIET